MKAHFKALKSTGEVYRGTREVESREALAQELVQKGEKLVEFESVAHGSLDIVERINAILARIKEIDKVLFARNLGLMINAGLPLSRALAVIARQSKNKKFRGIIQSIQADVTRGLTLHSSLNKHNKVFSSLFIAMVRAGEESGGLAQALKIVSTQMEQSYRLKKKVKGAMLYPSIVLSAMVIIGILMLIFVVPTLTETFKELAIDLPASTQFIIFISDTLKNNTLIALAILTLIVILFLWAIRTPTGKKWIYKVVLKLPVIGELAKETNAARTARTLSSLLASGVEVIHSLEITQDVLQSPQHKAVIAEVRVSVEKGGNMSEVFGKYEKLYPPFVKEMVAVGEETGGLAETLTNVADYYQEDVEQRTKDLSTIIEPILMVIIGAAVGFFAVSMITPMYSLTASI